jgi:hypothetical protein
MPPVATKATRTPNNDDDNKDNGGRWALSIQQRPRKLPLCRRLRRNDAFVIIQLSPKGLTPWGEYIENLDQNKKKSGTRFRPRSKLDWLAGWPTDPDLEQNEKKRPCKYLDSLNLELWNVIFHQKKVKNSKNELRQAPNKV